MPNKTTGTYEFRLFTDDTFIPLASSGSLSVISDAILVASPSSVAAGEAASVTVGWSGIADPSTHDWIGLYHPGDADTAFIRRAYDSSCTQTAGRRAKRYGWCSFAMNVAPGTYELRLFTDDTFIPLANPGPSRRPATLFSSSGYRGPSSFAAGSCESDP